MNIPKIRFPKYSNEWNYEPLNKYVERIVRKNKYKESNLVLTISAQYGLVDQCSFFNRNVSSANLDGYYLLYNGDFAYNKSYSNGYPWGAVKRLNLYDKGVVSSLYICFKNNNLIDSDYLQHYFETNKWYSQISSISVEGARNHGLLNIAVNDFFNTEHFFPNLDEQKDIAKILNLLDKKIELQTKKIEDLKLFKKGLINNELNNLNDCKIISLNDLGTTYSGLSGKTKEDFENGNCKFINFMSVLNDNIDISSLTTVKINSNEKQNKVENGDLFFMTSSETKVDVALCSTLSYEVKDLYLNSFCFGYRINDLNIINNEYLNCLLHSPKYRKQISNLGQGFTRVNISKNKLLELLIEVPDMKQQLRIVSINNRLKCKIDLENNKLNKLNELKKGLMQNMFV